MRGHRPAVGLEHVRVVWVHDVREDEGRLRACRNRCEGCECATHMIAVVWGLSEDFPEWGHLGQGPPEMRPGELPTKAESVPRLILQIRLGAVLGCRPPLRGIQHEAVTLPLEEGYGAVVLQQIDRQARIGGSGAELGGEAVQMTEVEERWEREDGVSVVAVYASGNGKAQLAKAILKLSIIEIELLAQHARIGVLVEYQQIDIRLGNGGRLPRPDSHGLSQLSSQRAVVNGGSGAGLVHDDAGREPYHDDEAGEREEGGEPFQRCGASDQPSQKHDRSAQWNEEQSQPPDAAGSVHHPFSQRDHRVKAEYHEENDQGGKRAPPPKQPRRGVEDRAAHQGTGQHCQDIGNRRVPRIPADHIQNGDDSEEEGIQVLQIATASGELPRGAVPPSCWPRPPLEGHTTCGRTPRRKRESHPWRSTTGQQPEVCSRRNNSSRSSGTH